MSKPRKNAPALYELIGGRSRLSPPGPPAAEAHEEESEVVEESFEEEAHHTILSPGRTVRMPVGYFFFGLAIIIATGVGCYMLGYKLRDAAYQREEKRQAQLEAPIEPLDRPVNSDLLGPGRGSPLTRPRADSGAGSGSGAVRPPSPAIGTGPGRMVVVAAGTPDPREKGVNYAVVATLGLERAEDLAKFLSERGLDVAVVKTNNVRLHSVVALKGFPSGTFRTEERRDFESSLKSLGAEYASQGGGRKDFGGLWWDRFDG